MKLKRRSFLRNTTSFGAFSFLNFGKSKRTPSLNTYTKDGGMDLCLAYFWGIEPRKVALARQMDVLGAVGGINTSMVNMKKENNFSFRAIKAVKDAWDREGLNFRVVEGPPSLYTKTKLGLKGRDEEIENFNIFLKNISELGIDVVCYNWMPVINWTRSDFDRAGRGGALVSAFDIEQIAGQKKITEYGELTHQKMWINLDYFLRAVVPQAEKYGVKLAMHPDDPPIDWIRGIPRIMTSIDAFKKLLDLYPSSSNGLTFCQGSFASMGDKNDGVDIPQAIRYFGKRNSIHFVHFRDVKGHKSNFAETFHDNGKTDMHASMQAYYDIGFRGPLRPDHVPTMYGDSNEHPGYSTIGTLFAIGYIRGLIEGVVKSS